MGVNGLLPILSEIQEKGTLERYRGKTLAIDTFGWLHRGLISCAQELCLDQPTRRYISSVMKKVDMLRHFGVEPYFVFDGSSLPTKEATNAERRKNRDAARLRADNFTKQGQSKLAWKEFMKAACVTSQMVKSLIIEFDKAGIKYVVAPYEADPQMVYLEKVGLCDGILSEDSDLLIFGCNRLITKLKDDGTCIEINRANFNKVKKVNDLPGYTLNHLQLVAMLSGCDYTKGVAGVGIRTAFTLVKKYGSYDRVILALKAEGKAVAEEYYDEYVKADLAFKYQKVFDPRSMALCPLTEYPENFDADWEVVESCCGKEYTQELWKGICLGHLDPRTHQTLVSREQSLTSLRSASVNYSTQPQKSTVPTVVKKTSVLDYFAANKKSVNTTESFVSRVSINNTTSVTREGFASTENMKTVTNVNSTTSATSFVSTPSLSYEPRNNKRSQQSPTSKKLQRITGTITQNQGAISEFFQKKPELKQVSLPTSLPSRRLSFDDDSDFTNECSSPAKKESKNSSSDNLTDNDEDTTNTEDPENVFLDANSSFVDEIEDSLVESQIDEEPPQPQPESESDLDELEESPVKILNPNNNVNENSEIFKFCHSLRINFLFDEAQMAKKARTQGGIPKITHTPLAKADEKANKSTKSDPIKSDPVKPTKPKPIGTNLAKFAFRG